MKIGIVADTHDNLSAVHTIVNEFERRGVEVILHCGDVIAPPIIPAFDGFEFHLVFGNNDGETDGLRRAIDDLGKESMCHGRFTAIELDGIQFAMLHGEDLVEVEAYARAGTYDYVLYGHHHERREERIGETWIVNPGAHFPSVPVEHQTVVVLDTKTGEHTFVPLLE